jgi:uncharacterized membrane protein
MEDRKNEVTELLTIIICLVGPGKVLAEWSTLPDLVPVHFNIWGVPDANGSKVILAILAFIGLLLYFVLTIPQRNPANSNIPFNVTDSNRAEHLLLVQSLMTILKLEMAFVFSYLDWMIVEIARGHASGIGPWFGIGMIVMVMGTISWYYWQGSRIK